MQRTGRKIHLLHLRQVDVCKQGALFHIYKQHFPKTCHEEVLHPLPSPPGGCGTKCAICQPSEAKRPIIWTSFASLLCLHPHTGSRASPGTRPSRMRGVPFGGLDECAVPRCILGQREHVLGRGHGKKSGEPTPRGHSWGNKLATSIAHLPGEQARN